MVNPPVSSRNAVGTSQGEVLDLKTRTENGGGGMESGEDHRVKTTWVEE